MFVCTLEIESKKETTPKIGGEKREGRKTFLLIFVLLYMFCRNEVVGECNRRSFLISKIIIM